MLTLPSFTVAVVSHTQCRARTDRCEHVDVLERADTLNVDIENARTHCESARVLLNKVQPHVVRSVCHRQGVQHPGVAGGS